jgi:hypothetical protein
MPRETDQALKARVREVIRVLSDDGHIPKGSWRPVYAWDLDSTVASTVHRRHVAQAIMAGESDPSAWDDYAMMCAKDAPIAGSVALMREMPHGFHVAISGRSALAEDLTWEWFFEHDVPFRAALLRIHGDYSPNAEYKIRVLRELEAQGADVRLFFEDWQEAAIEIAEGSGVPVFGVNPFDPRELGERGGAI